MQLIYTNLSDPSTAGHHYVGPPALAAASDSMLPGLQVGLATAEFSIQPMLHSLSPKPHVYIELYCNGSHIRTLWHATCMQPKSDIYIYIYITYIETIRYISLLFACICKLTALQAQMYAVYVNNEKYVL